MPPEPGVGLGVGIGVGVQGISATTQDSPVINFFILI